MPRTSSLILIQVRMAVQIYRKVVGFEETQWSQTYSSLELKRIKRIQTANCMVNLQHASQHA